MSLFVFICHVYFMSLHVFYVFIISFHNYRTSIQIFLFYKFFCTSLSKVELEILRNSSTVLRSSHPRCSIKKLFLKILRHSQEDTCVGIYFLIKFQACNFIKMRPEHRYFLVNIITYKNTHFDEHLWTAASVFLERVL